MVKELMRREKYYAPQSEAEELVPDILCDSLVGGDLEGVEEGDPWTF